MTAPATNHDPPESGGARSDGGAARGRPPAWLNGRAWRAAGYVATGLWFLLVLGATAGSAEHVLRDLIFVVPLAGWVAGLLIGGWLKRRHARRAGNGENAADADANRRTRP